MKPMLKFFLVFALASCTSTNVEATETPLPTAIINTAKSPTNALPLPSPIPTRQTFAPSPMAEIPCDPFLTDYCISAGHFLLERPIRPPGNDRVDPSYRYASTANGTRDPHHGVEFANASGTPIHAAAQGTVVFAGPDEVATYSPWPNYYGNLVVLEHA